MNDSVSKLKELLFDQESATLSELRTNIELVADAERRTFDDLSSRIERLRDALQGLERSSEAERVRTAQELRQELRRLDSELAVRIEPLVRRAGTPEAWRASVAEVLDDAITDARDAKHDQMTRAVAPLVVRTVHTELRNSEDELVQMLYPHTGLMVKAYVASAMKDMLNQINRRLEMNPTMLRFRSLVSGYSMADLLLAETQRLDIDELYLIRRGSGALIQRWPESPARSNSDIHLGGVIAAINDFASHAFQQDGGNLRSFNLDDFTVFLRASPVYLLAAKCRGTAVRGVEGMIDAEFVQIVSRQHEIEVEQPGQALGEKVPFVLLADLRQRLEAGIDEKQARIARAGLPFHPLKALATVLLLALLGAGGWWGWASYEASVARATAHEVIEADAALKGFPLDFDVGWRGRTIGVTGFAPSPTAKSELLAHLRSALPESEINVERLAVLSGGPDLSPQLAEVRRAVTGLDAEVTSRGIRRSLDLAIGRLDQAKPDLDRLLALGDPARRSVVSAPASAIEQGARELSEQRRAMLAAGNDPTTLNRLQVAVAQTAGRLQQAAGELALLVGGESAKASPPPKLASGRSAPADLTESAADASLAAERVATIAAAAVQVSSLKIPEPVVNAPTARERLDAFTRANAIFFANNDEYRAPERANAVIDELVRLMAATPQLVRIVGYTDERGGSPRNVPLSQSRADKVALALVARGVPRERLTVVGRASGLERSTAIGPHSPNRRVEFEVGFDDEASP